MQRSLNDELDDLRAIAQETELEVENLTTRLQHCKQNDYEESLELEVVYSNLREVRHVATDSSEVSDEFSALFDDIDPTISEDDVGKNMEIFLAATNEDVDDAGSCDGEILRERRSPNLGQAKTLIAPWTLADGVPAAMFGEGPQTEIELGNLMVDVFNHLHPIDYIYCTVSMNIGVARKPATTTPPPP